MGGGGKVSGNRGSGSAHGSRIPTMMFSMFATFASIYVAGRLWQDSQHRVHLMKELDRITGQGQTAISVEDTLKIIACREQQKKLSAIESELVLTKQEGFSSDNSADRGKKRQLVVIGVMTVFGHKNNRDAVRKAWMGSGGSLNKMETDKGVAARFVIGRSATRGDTLDRTIDSENQQTNDFIILDDHVEDTDGLSKKAKLFFAHAVSKWDADYYAKVNDNIYVDIDALGATLATYLDKPRAYIGCMKSGEVFSEQSHKWYEPDWWKFGNKKSYFRHASGEMYVLSQALAKFISINRCSAPTHMMMSVPGRGLSGSMSIMWMNLSSAAHLGPQELFVQASNRLIEKLVSSFHITIQTEMVNDADIYLCRTSYS